MKSSIRFVIIAMTLLILVIGCSRGNRTPMSPSDSTFIAENAPLEDTQQALGVLGAYSLSLDLETKSAELQPLRNSAIGESYIVSGAGFFTIKPCSDCLKIYSLEVLPGSGIKVTFSVSHPFGKGNGSLPPSAVNRLDLDIFDLALVVAPESTTQQLFPLTAAQASSGMCFNADGYTRELAKFYGINAACPYFLAVDNSGGTILNYNKFEMGTKNLLFDSFFTGNGAKFTLFLTMGYGASAKKFTRLAPVYYNPEFNRKSAWKVEVTPPEGADPPTRGKTWDDQNITTKYDVTVKVYDWQQNATVAASYPDPAHTNQILKASKVSKVSAEILGMTNALKSVTSATQGDGSPMNPLIYKISIANEKKLPIGVYPGLVKVTDERVPNQTITPGQVDSLVHTPDGVLLSWYAIPEFATYQVFTATVVRGDTIEIITPNGGENWVVGSPANIQWASYGTVGNVKIDLSTDGGVNYSIPVANDIANSGTFNLLLVGDWSTAHARIKIQDMVDPLIVGESSNDFTISCTGMTPPSNVQATDGVYFDKVRLTWTAVFGATGYNIYRDGLLKQENYTTLSWDDSTVTPGVVYNYQLETVQGNCISLKSANEPGSACIVPTAPTGVTASDGTYTNRVLITWTAVTGVTSYNVYRDSILVQAGVTGTTFSDYTADRGVIYTFEVESQNTCGVSATRGSDDGYAQGCLVDDNETCADATIVNITDTVSDCVDQIDLDWYHTYTSPNGIKSTSTITLTIATGTVDIEVYGREPGYSCPGNLITSATDVGSTVLNLPASTKSDIYIKLTGNTGRVNFSMALNILPALTNLPVEIYVARNSTNQWPYNGSQYLTRAILQQMMTWANSFWSQYGYFLNWDQTENFMSSQYYNLDNDGEVVSMHSTYGYNKDKLALYFVNQLQPGAGNTAYCIVQDPKANHNVDLVFSVYSPGVWFWQTPVAHEHGHAIGYYFDQYLYDQYSCTCGNMSCIPASLPRFLFGDPLGCYDGNMMWYDMGWPWSQYDLTRAQNQYIYMFHFQYPLNFPFS